MARAAASKAACCGFESYQACIFVMFDKTKKFIGEVVVELKKVSWSTRQELIDATWIVIISTAALMMYIGAIDFALSKFLGIIIR